jgi:hypothetical protein
MYFAYRFYIGYRISQAGLAFSSLYDQHCREGKTPELAFLLSAWIIKNCHPFNRLAQEEWENALRAFAKLENPKKGFLRILMAPARKVVRLFKSKDFLKAISNVRSKTSSEMEKGTGGKRNGMTEEELDVQDAKDRKVYLDQPFPLTNPSVAREVGEQVMGASLEAEKRGMKLSDLLLEQDEKWLKEQRKGQK